MVFSTDFVMTWNTNPLRFLRQDRATDLGESSMKMSDTVKVKFSTCLFRSIFQVPGTRQVKIRQEGGGKKEADQLGRI